MFLVVALSLIGCGSAPEPAPSLSLQSAPPALSLSPAASGEFMLVSVQGMAPNSAVSFAGSLSGVGAGPCPPELGGTCLDIVDAVLLATARTDADGAATVGVQVPRSLTGEMVSIQAVGFGPITTTAVSSRSVMQGPWPDTDGDLLADPLETFVGSDPGNVDTDGDGLTDGNEVLVFLTDPTDADTDADGLSDDEELAEGTDPRNTDSDGDGLSDGDEIAFGANPLIPDSDGDGLSDGDEILFDADPTLEDTDGDGILDGEEVAMGTSPAWEDSDFDGLRDDAELRLGTDPLRADTDGDGLYDSVEIRDTGTDPLDPDMDGDGVPDGIELDVWGTDPRNPDTDGDGVDDGDEIAAGTPPGSICPVDSVLHRGACLSYDEDCPVQELIDTDGQCVYAPQAWLAAVSADEDRWSLQFSEVLCAQSNVCLIGEGLDSIDCSLVSVGSSSSDVVCDFDAANAASCLGGLVNTPQCDGAILETPSICGAVFSNCRTVWDTGFDTDPGWEDTFDTDPGWEDTYDTGGWVETYPVWDSNPQHTWDTYVDTDPGVTAPTFDPVDPDDPTTWVGTAWKIEETPQLMFVAPAGASGLLAPLLETFNVGALLRSYDASTQSFSVNHIQTGSSIYEQDECFLTPDVGTASVVARTVQFSENVSYDYPGGTSVVALSLTATMNAAGTGFDNADITLAIPDDAGVSGLDLGGQGVCDLAAGFGFTCSPCTHQAGDCLVFQVSDASLMRIEATEITALDPACTTASAACGCDQGGRGAALLPLLGLLLMRRRQR